MGTREHGWGPGHIDGDQGTWMGTRAHGRDGDQDTWMGTRAHGGGGTRTHGRAGDQWSTHCHGGTDSQ